MKGEAPPGDTWPMFDDDAVVIQHNSGSREWEPDEWKNIYNRLRLYDDGPAYFDHEPRPNEQSPVWIALTRGDPMPDRFVREHAAAPANPMMLSTFGWPSKWREDWPHRDGIASYHRVNDSMRPAMALYDRLTPSVYLRRDIADDPPIVQMNRAFQITRNTILEAKRVALPGQDIVPFVSFRYGADRAWASDEAVLGVLMALSVERIERAIYWENPDFRWNPPDYTPVLKRWYALNRWTWPDDTPTAELPRLWWFQTVGHSGPNNPELGRVSSRICTPEDGWWAYEPRVAALRDALGEDANVGWFGHNPFGTWFCCRQLMTETSFSSMLFEQWALAREHFPQLADAAALCALLDRYGFVDRLAYIGAPRSEEVDDEPYAPEPTHNDVAAFSEYYGFLDQCTFRIVVHDALTAVAESGESPSLLVNEPWLIERGVIPGTEAIPARDQDWRLTEGVIMSCAERRLHFTESKTEPFVRGNGKPHPGFFSIDELVDAGMPIIVDVTHPWDGLDLDGDELQQWRWDQAMRLAADPRIDMIAVPLHQLDAAGFDVRALYDACEAGRRR